MSLKPSIFSCVQPSKLLLIASVITLVGCGSSDDNDSSDDDAYVKLYNASKNAPAIFLTIDEDLDEDDDDEVEITYTGVEYGQSGGNKELEKNSYFYELAWQDEDSSDRDNLEIVAQGQLEIKNDAIQMIVLSDDITSPQVNIYDIEVIDDDNDVDDDLFNLRVLNMHPDSEGIDIYLSKSDETFNEAVLIGQYSYTMLSDNQKFEQDEYIFYIASAGSDEVLFQSDDIDYAYATQYVMVVRENTAAGQSPYVLDLVSNSSTTEYLDFNSEGQFRVYNAIIEHELIPNYQSSLDLYINGEGDEPVLSDVPVGQLSETIVKDKGDYSLDVTVAGTDEAILSNHLLTLPESADKTVFLYLKEDDVDEDGDGDVDEDGDGQVDEVEVTINSLVVNNSNRESIYDHTITMVNLVDSDDFTSIKFYFVRNDETIDTATNKSTVGYTSTDTINLLNNTYQVFAVAQEDSSEIILTSFEFVLDESSTEQFMIIEIDENSPTGYKVEVVEQDEAD
ncbi:hypothetical protein [Thalassomonas haliotis]|uniref:DUF4397 domain-containing protein n=1 Tax=Thalassomonas haliotis TaxID=485448 RepID=A0ABY7V9V8_9GAMM|nr:hypothetical protein [Thalassomonas haliotis]WDE10101.1 DUF4397 domain-containing protein [Thalassomonas haliotis]